MTQVKQNHNKSPNTFSGLNHMSDTVLRTLQILTHLVQLPFEIGAITIHERTGTKKLSGLPRLIDSPHDKCLIMVSDILKGISDDEIRSINHYINQHIPSSIDTQ